MYGLLTIPTTPRPPEGFPAILFNHGYIPPHKYRTLERYGSYVDRLAKNGYIVWKIDYRGHDQSEGEAIPAYFSPNHAIDILEALASLRNHPSVNPNKIGMWGHSMGGHLIVSAMVVRPDEIKAGVIYGGLTGTYDEVFDTWYHLPRPDGGETQIEYDSLRKAADPLIEKYGSPTQDSPFWKAITPTNFLEKLSAPIQLHHGTADISVSYKFSEDLARRLKENNKETELYLYPGGDHDIAGIHFRSAMARTVKFFNRYLK